MSAKLSGFARVLALVAGAAGLAGLAVLVEQYRTQGTTKEAPTLSVTKAKPSKAQPYVAKPGADGAGRTPVPTPVPATDAGSLLAAGLKSFNSHYYREAIEELQKAVAIDPGLAQAWEYLGSAYAAKQQPTEACRAYVKARTLTPASTRATQWAALGDLCFDAHAYAEAISAYRAAANLDPGLKSKVAQVARSQKERGDSNLTTSNVKTAALAYEVAYCLTPDDGTMRAAFEKFTTNPSSGESLKQGLCAEAR